VRKLPRLKCQCRTRATKGGIPTNESLPLFNLADTPQIGLSAPTLTEQLVDDKRSKYRRNDWASETPLLTRACFPLVGTLVRKAEVPHFRSANGLYFNINMKELRSRSYIVASRNEPFTDASVEEQSVVKIIAEIERDFSLSVYDVEVWQSETAPAEQAILERQLVIAVLQNRSRRRGYQAAIAV